MSLSVLVAVCAGFGSCSDDDEPGNGSGSGAAAIGTYSFDGKEYCIRSGAYAENDNMYSFIFMPTAAGEKTHTVIMLSQSKVFAGQAMPVDGNGVWHNDTYVFSYDDPFFYYSRFNALKGGTIFVEAGSAAGEFTVKMENIVLPDGRPFALSFEGALPSADESGM